MGGEGKRKGGRRRRKRKRKRNKVWWARKWGGSRKNWGNFDKKHLKFSNN